MTINRANASDASRLLDELLAYASYHFEYQEGVWEKSLGRSVISRNHHDSHQAFFTRIQTFRQSRASQEEVLGELDSTLSQ